MLAVSIAACRAGAAEKEVSFPGQYNFQFPIYMQENIDFI